MKPLFPTGAPNTKVLGVRSEGTQTAQISTTREVASVPLGPTSWGALRTALAELQVRLIDAQVYLQKGLSLARLVETRPELEEAVASWIDALSKGTAVQEDIAKRVAALAPEGPRALAMLVDIVDAQLASRPVEGLREPIAASVLAALAGSQASIDHRAAFASALASTHAIGAGLSKDAAYPGLKMGYAGSNTFTNEPGLPDLVSKVNAGGGAAIGVGGAILDVGSMGSSLIISVDANPRIKEAIHLYTGVLLAIDQRVRRDGLDDQQRAAMVLEWLERGPNQETTEALRALGMPADQLATLDQQLEAIAKKLRGESTEAHPIPLDLWCRGPRAEERVLHLTRLALEGKIVAVTSDLADPALVDRINKLLEAHDTRAQVIHLSNSLDYIAEAYSTLSNLGRIKLNHDAALTTSAGSAFRSAVMTTMPDEYYLVDELGTLQKPKINRASDWLGETRKARGFQEMISQTEPHLRQLQEWAKS